MLRGMTAFGRCVKATPWGRLQVEVSSLNRKHFELRCQLPDPLRAFEPAIRRWIAQEISRGAVTLSASLLYDSSTPIRLELNAALLPQVDAAATQLEEALRAPRSQCLEAVLNMVRGELLSHSVPDGVEPFEPALQSAVADALQAAVKMKEEEGAFIAADLTQRLDRMTEALGAIEKETPRVMQGHRDRLVLVARDLLEVDEQRLQEIQVQAERYDATEEIVRLTFHLQRLKHVLGSAAPVSGRDLEFRLQEVLRETNTLSAKLSDGQITEQALIIKGEVERMRQQVQNVE